MRTVITLAALAASALAVPYAKRDVVTDVNVVYVTNVVTVTGGEQPAATPAEHYGHGHQWATTWAVTTVVEGGASSSAAPAPPPPASTSQAQAPPPAVSSAPAAAPSSASAAAPQAAPTGYQDTCIYHHNLHRANHSSGDIAWSDSLASTAQAIAETCIYAHNTQMNGGGYGQNIAAGVESNNISAVITDLFYNAEEPYYQQASNNYQSGNPDMSTFASYGHMTQIVWKGTTEVGCYTAHCPSGLANVGSDVSPYFTVCNYSPPGNYANEYGSNIAAPDGKPTVQWNSS